MRIHDLQVNHRTTPLGYKLSTLYFSWKAEGQGKRILQKKICIFEALTGFLLYDSGWVEAGNGTGMAIQLELAPRSRYTWEVMVLSDEGETGKSPRAWFETGKMDEPWAGKWIGAPAGMHAVWMKKSFIVEKKVQSARLYICGLGLYEVYLGENKVGDEYLMPGYYSYDLTTEYQTLDLTSVIKSGKNELKILLGNGWYKGRFVFDGVYWNIYGDQLKLLLEIHLEFEDGTKKVLGSGLDFEGETTPIGLNSIYDGEEQDYTQLPQKVKLCLTEGPLAPLTERTSAPLERVETIVPKTVLHHEGEIVLDFGEMITGWVEFFCHAPKGTRVTLQYGELLQDGMFYRDNLRTAKAAFSYVSDGHSRKVRPHFTYYGFRYVKIEGMSKIKKEDFVAWRLMSLCPRTGCIKTGNAKVNRLLDNVYASLQCNFLDIPTDCPQRDERMGWTGDIAIFGDSAMLQVDCAGFMEHYLEQLRLEQQKLGGSVPFFVPRPKLDDQKANPFLKSHGACTWGDVATLLPWTLYQHYRDETQLRQFYPIMKDWTGYVKGRAQKNAIPWLWQQDMQLGDWLALDQGDAQSPMGKTDTGFIASAYYYQSTEICGKAARVLGLEQEAAQWEEDARRIREAFQKTFLDDQGKLSIPETQTSYAILLSFQLYRPGQVQPAIDRLKELIESNDRHLNTGFVGTPLLCQVLSKYGAHDLACELFMQETYPSWLYEVNLGAVSIWERWNSLNPDGHISGIGMNSMNHYAYGSIIAWVYRWICGFQEDVPEENRLSIRPMPCTALGFAEGEMTAPWGTYRSSWKIRENKEVEYQVHIPFNGKGRVVISGLEEKILEAGDYIFVVRQ